ncbi:TPA: hypothetical protein ACHBXG_005396, partial [Klebsiella pneumoniae]
YRLDRSCDGLQLQISVGRGGTWNTGAENDYWIRKLRAVCTAHDNEIIAPELMTAFVVVVYKAEISFG